MIAPAWVSVVSLAGWLVLSVFALRARKLKAGRTVVYGLAWAVIFLAVGAVFAAVM